MSHRARRVDENHPEIKSALRAVGAFVVDLSAVGGGLPDLLVGFRKAWYVLEVKDGTKPPSKRKLTPDQETFFLETEARSLPAFVVNTPQAALRAIGAV